MAFFATSDNFKGSEQIPWLMLYNKDKPDERQFVSLRKGGIIRTVNLPEARVKQCLETLGWLVTISEDSDMNLLHPYFTRVQINLPHVTTLKDYEKNKMKNHLSIIRKAVLSSGPEEGKDYALMVIYGYNGFLAFWRPEDEHWTAINCSSYSFLDINFYEELCYGVTNRWGVVLAFDIWEPNPTWALHVDIAEDPYDYISIGHNRPYIVESDGKMLIVIQFLRKVWPPDFLEDVPFVFDIEDESSVQYKTFRFKIFAFNPNRTDVFVEHTSLGENALFLGDNAAVSVGASRFSGIRANCIYYTDNLTREGIAIYNMEDGSLRPCYEGAASLNLIYPPLWVHPSSFSCATLLFLLLFCYVVGSRSPCYFKESFG